MGWSLFARHMKKQGVFLPISMNILMRRSINIARQAGKPEGGLGRLIAFIMLYISGKIIAGHLVKYHEL